MQEIKISENILKKKGEKKVMMIENEIRREEGETIANLTRYNIEQEAAANVKLYTDNYVQLHVANSITNNTKFYFSGGGENSGLLGGIISRIINNR